ncbi:formimidoylglutamate deiminase [Pseudooceanicola sp. LIPI14-2-Ac024]|uniref:formimidoylglutamate deiminase n=1 Tax=Pseudooceanicola sp. LIPI14-2-Ac024 TaxID=3344875 RepID=UPI0035CFEFA8
MTKIWAANALLPDGWAEDVLITFDAGGMIASVETGAPAAGEQIALLLPAPANGHSHAFQRAMAGLTERRGPDPRDTFWTWRALMYRFLDRLTPDHVEAIAAFVQMEMLEAGYATNVEFHYLHHRPGGAPYDNIAEMAERIAAATATTGIGLTLLPVHYQFGGCDQRPLGPGQIRFGTDPDSFARLHAASTRALTPLPADTRIGVAPHSLRAVAREALPGLAALAPEGPFHMHLAEQVAEVDEVEAAWGLRPVEWVLEHMTPDARHTFIHCTQMLSHETEGLARSGAVAGLCPITESSLGDGIFDGVRWFGAGGAVSIGSDSNIRIALSEELRTLDYSQRLRDRSRAALATPERSTGRRLYEAVLTGGAASAGRPTGAIAPGCYADLMALDTTHVDLEGRRGDTLLDSYIFAGDDRMVRDVWSAGRHVVTGGRHVARDGIVAAYRATMRDLGDSL